MTDPRLMTRSASFTPVPHLLALVAMLALPGCVAKTALDVATLPVRAGSKAVDLATTSQSEADEKRGREMREREERIADLEMDPVHCRRGGQPAAGLDIVRRPVAQQGGGGCQAPGGTGAIANIS